MLKTLFSGWTFDVKTALVTLVATPVLIYVLLIIRKYVKAWGGYAVEGVMYWLSRVFTRSLAGSLTLKRYCRMRLAEDNRYLFVPSSLDVKLEVDEAFVTVTLDQQAGKGAVYDHTNVLTVGNRIRVIGDPGSGKSSLVKRLFRDACYLSLEKPLKARLPILVELKSLSVPDRQPTDKLGDWFVKKLRDDASKNRVYQMEQCFDAYAESTGLLVFLDGLDEVSTSNYPRVQRAINELGRTLGQMSESSTIVLTMRTQFHQQVKDSFRGSFGQALFLKPFSPSDIYDFLTRWPFPRNRDQAITRIYGELTDRPTLREMCSNPLVLSMYVAEDQADGHVVAPESRTEFYRRVTEELLLKRRLQQIGPTSAHTKLREQREQILGRLAYGHMLDSNQPTNALEWSDAIRVSKDLMKCSDADAEAIFREIAKETGLVVEERPSQSFRFIHLTFCEFLAAYEAVQGQRDGWATLIERHKAFQKSASQPQVQSRLLEVIPFACGLVPRVSRDSALSEVASIGDDALQARCFLETKQYDHSTWPAFVQKQRAALLQTPESKWDDRWLRDLHLFNVVVRDSVQYSLHMATLDANIDLDQFFQTLVKNQKESLSTLLSAYAAQDAAAAFRLADMSHLDLAVQFPNIVVRNCDQAPFLALIVERALGDLAKIDRWASLVSEAALRSRAVAEAVFGIARCAALSDRVTSVPKKKRWFRAGIVPETLLTQLLTIASTSSTEDEKLTECLETLKLVPAPGRSWASPGAVAGGIAVVVGLLALSVIVTSPVLHAFDNSVTKFDGQLEWWVSKWGLWPGPAVVLGTYALMPLLMFAQGRRRLYMTLVTHQDAKVDQFAKLKSSRLWLVMPMLTFQDKLALFGFSSATRGALKKIRYLRSRSADAI